MESKFPFSKFFKNKKTNSVEVESTDVVAEYIIKRLSLTSTTSVNREQFKDVVKVVKITIPEEVLPVLKRKTIQRGAYFWAEQNLQILKDQTPAQLQDEQINLRKDNPPNGTGLMHFYTEAVNYHSYGLNDYGKTKIKIYFVSCLIRFIRDLKVNKTLTCKNFEVITNEKFAKYLVYLGFKPLNKSKVVHGAKDVVVIGRENLLALEPKLMSKLSEYLRRKKEILRANNNSRANFGS